MSFFHETDSPWVRYWVALAGLALFCLYAWIQYRYDLSVSREGARQAIEEKERKR